MLLVESRSIASNIFPHVTFSVPSNHLMNKSVQHSSVSAGLFDLIISNCPGCTPKNIPILFHLAAYSGRTYLHKSFISGRSFSTYKAEVINNYAHTLTPSKLTVATSLFTENVHNCYN